MAKLITKQELSSLLQTNPSHVVLLDVREPSEYTSSDLPAIHSSAHNIPINTLKEAFHLNDTEFKNKYGFEKPKPTDSIVCYCKLGGRAQKATDTLAELGYENVRCFKGSASEWWSN
ncbi:hypothetical protein FDP41_006521 [Naegleria fowleri]|uniref:Rhodanese domain-containing protein n=1 Tax=Naegleria fowleri TaxID=5763 RepID=A0A6A5BNL5_NAEFO|nr:uncharacterized protein FDP41_006521 [Naegleria fowleri]KAF0974489.1 hypothetical protein FDP41_006521 [Naegleria fowleri]CAG4716982.1 unnamed protein product [Naegleria fowleri]